MSLERVVILIASSYPLLEATAREALARTTPEPHTITVVTEPVTDPHAKDYGSLSHGVRLQAGYAALDSEVRWLVTLDDDAAPLQVGWLSWLHDRRPPGAVWSSFWQGASGRPHVAGTLYFVPWLRSVHASFLPRLPVTLGWDTGQGLPDAPGIVATPARHGAYPGWGDVALDERARPIWAHLGGGTLGYSDGRAREWAASVQAWLDARGIPPLAP